MSGFHPYGDGTGYGNFNGGSSQGAGGFNRDGGDHQEGGSQQRQYTTQTVIPVTIKTINSATVSGQDAPYVSYGMELSYVRFIGVIRSIDTSNANATIYRVEDGTGDITFRQWNEDSKPEGEEDGFDDGDNGFTENPFKEYDYVEVVAIIREFNNKKQLQTQRLAKIEDFNYISYHFLSAVKIYLNHKDGSLLAGSDANAGNTGAASDSQTHSSGGLFVSEENNLTTAERIKKFISERGNSMPEGVPTQLIAQDLNLKLNEVDEIANQLTDGGELYATNEDNMFLAI